MTYLAGGVFTVVTTVRIRGRRFLVALKEQLPGIFVGGLEEPHQGLMLLRIKIPQRATSALAWENPAN